MIKTIFATQCPIDIGITVKGTVLRLTPAESCLLFFSFISIFASFDYFLPLNTKMEKVWG